MTSLLLTMKLNNYAGKSRKKFKGDSPKTPLNVACSTHLLFYQLTSRSGVALIL